MEIAYSVNRVPIRLTTERWIHIVESHDDMAGYYEEVLETVEQPDLILPGQAGSLIAVRSFGTQRYMLVVYRELSVDDGFIIAAYFTGRIDRRRAIWSQH